MAPEMCIRHKIIGGITDIQHAEGLPVFRYLKKLFCLVLIKIRDPDASQILTCCFQHHVCGNNGGICCPAGFAALGMCPAGSLVVADKQDKRCTIIQIDLSVLFVITLFGEIHILLIITKGAEFLNLGKALRSIQDEDPLRLRINCCRRPPACLQNLLKFSLLYRSL